MGAGQGLIVTSFNFLAHKIEENNLIRKAFEDPDGKPAENMESVKEEYGKIKHLFTKAMILAVKAVPIGDIKLDLENIFNPDGDFAADTRWSKNTKINSTAINGKRTNLTINGKIVVTLFKSSFSSWASLGARILHEYYHVADLRSQLYRTTYMNMLNKYSDNDTTQLNFTDWAENRVCKFIFSLGDTSSVYGTYKHLYHKKK